MGNKRSQHPVQIIASYGKVSFPSNHVDLDAPVFTKRDQSAKAMDRINNEVREFSAPIKPNPSLSKKALKKKAIKAELERLTNIFNPPSKPDKVKPKKQLKKKVNTKLSRAAKKAALGLT